MLPIIFGISGKYLTKDEIELFTKYSCAGFILFSRNIESREQIIKLINSLRSLYSERQILIFTDQEGGRVARIKPPIAKNLYPASSYFSGIYERDKLLGQSLVKDNYSKLMLELKELGIDSPCGPVADLFFAEADKVIGDRSFGKSVETVVDLCNSAIEAIVSEGGVPIIKHIPGHGRANLDSHFDLPIINASLAELEITDFEVFKRVAAENTQIWAMTAHIKYLALDSELPVTLSQKSINYIRENIGFKGTLISDDVCMLALHGEIGKMHLLVKNLLNALQNNEEVNDNDYNSVLEFYKINPTKIQKNDLVAVLMTKMEQLDNNFLASIVKVTKMSIDAGCDFALHCSGDINEMRAICTNYTIN